MMLPVEEDYYYYYYYYYCCHYYYNYYSCYYQDVKYKTKEYVGLDKSIAELKADLSGK